MIDKVRLFIAQESLLAPGACLIVGLSGGADSMVLLDLLVRLGYNSLAAHCNFHLRGAESDRDAAFVRRWCSKADIPFTSVDFNTVRYACERKISIEMAARELRYCWFERLCCEKGADAVAVAHHKDDSVETVLLNLIRGTGIRGLIGIAPVHGKVVRPLLCVTRAEIEGYAAERQLPYVEDSTNREEIFLRNAIRLKIMPALEALNPAVREAIFRTSQHLSGTEKIYNDAIHRITASLFQDSSIDIDALRRTPHPQTVLFEILTPFGFTPSTIEDIASSMDAPSGKIFYARGYRLIKDRNRFMLDLKEARAEQRSFQIGLQCTGISYPIVLTMERQAMPVQIRKDRHFLFADADRLIFPLELRRWREGDWFIPFGMKGRKKLSDYFSDRKFSIKEKEEAWVVVSDGEIVWIVGERSDHRFRVTEKTKDVYIMEYREDEKSA